MAPPFYLHPIILTKTFSLFEQQVKESGPSISTFFLYVLVVLGIIAVSICLFSILYGLSSQHRRTRFAAVYDNEDERRGSGRYRTFYDGGWDGEGTGMIRFGGCGFDEDAAEL